MTSFVREILSASGKLGDKEDLATKVRETRVKEKEWKNGEHSETTFPLSRPPA